MPELPSTLAEIRAALPEDQHAAFDEEMYSTPLEHLARRAILGWATPPEDRVAAERALQRVRDGDLTGLVNTDGNPGGRPIA